MHSDKLSGSTTFGDSLTQYLPNKDAVPSNKLPYFSIDNARVIYTKKV